MIIRRILFAFALLLCLNCFSQVEYAPINRQDLERAGRLLAQEKMNELLANNYLALGPVSLGPVERFVSYNPIEGVRLRLGGKTNEKFSRRFALDFLLAYGTNDSKLKYGLTAAVSFKKKPKSVYAFPANVLSISFKDDSYMPNFPNYDMLYYSLSTWKKYYLSYRRQAEIKYLYEFSSGLGLSPFAGFHSTYSSMYYNNDTAIETLSKTYNYYNIGGEFIFRPRRNNGGNSSFNARLQSLPSVISIRYNHNFFSEDLSTSYSVASFLLSERMFVGRHFALDVRVRGGKIFGSTISSLYFTPNQSYGLVSNPYGMNLLEFGRYFYRKEYVQAFVQLNLGGLLADNISFLKKYRINEFVYGKALYGEYKPYYEVGIGLDNLFSCLGVEFIRSFTNEKELGNGFWGVRLRLRQVGL